MARFSIVACLALAAGSLVGCGQNQPEPGPTATETVDPRVASLTSIVDLKVAKETCKDVQPTYSGDNAAIAKACTDKLSELMRRDEIPNFSTGLRYFNRQLSDGKKLTIEAYAAEAALTRWLQENAPKADDTTLWGWHNQLPEKDTLFVYSSIRRSIFDEIGN